MTSVGVINVIHYIIMANIQGARNVNQFLAANVDMHDSRVYCKN